MCVFSAPGRAGGLGKWRQIRCSSCPQGAPSLADDHRCTPWRYQEARALRQGNAIHRAGRAGSGLGVVGASRRRWHWTQALKDEKEFVVSIGQKEGRAKEGPDGRRWEAERGVSQSPRLSEPRRPGGSAPRIGSRIVWGAHSSTHSPPPISLPGSAGCEASARLPVGFRSPAASVRGRFGQSRSDAAPRRGVVSRRPGAGRRRRWAGAERPSAGGSEGRGVREAWAPTHSLFRSPGSDWSAGECGGGGLAALRALPWGPGMWDGLES